MEEPEEDKRERVRERGRGRETERGSEENEEEDMIKRNEEKGKRTREGLSENPFDSPWDFQKNQTDFCLFSQFPARTSHNDGVLAPLN